MSETSGRTVSVLVTSGTEWLGTVGPFPVAEPWWAEVGSVVTHLEGVLGTPVVVLRLVDVENGGGPRDGPRDGHTTYHVEALDRPAAGPADLRPGAPDVTGRPVPGDLAGPVAHRAEWAKASGVREALAWAQAALREAGRPAEGPVRQVRTWNLAGLFRIPTRPGPVWLKITPGFASDEARAIGMLAAQDPGLVPAIVAADTPNRRVLLEHVPGGDCHGASREIVVEAVSRLARAQAALAEHGCAPPDGLPDRTPSVLAALVGGLLDGEAADDLNTGELRLAHRLAGRLPSLAASLESCGLPCTLVHGDFHPGNWMAGPRGTVVLDLADSHYGHPVLDGLRPRDFLPGDLWEAAAEAWCETWAAAVPGCDPARALLLAEPLQHLAYAVRYQEFLDNIEPSERRYHEGDPAQAVRAAVTAAEAIGVL
ncbi:aminoglycoside phosphotransferase family protein [Streptosporangium sp. NPDC049046]|uniref:aminoglycoside phosphotransferase family protein n=1 Tax=unclassified Streptosporangium TaxID=2632669 RepID=UPI003429A4D2